MIMNLMQAFLGGQTQATLHDDIARQRPVPCKSCDRGWHAPWWNKSTAAPSHWTNEMIPGWSSLG